MGWDRFFRGKRHPHFLQRLAFGLPRLDETIWIHAVSVGEVKASVPFFRLLKARFPNRSFCITTTTATGFAEAKRSFLDADLVLYSPLDFSFVVRRFVQKLSPKLFICVESDFWPNLLSQIKSCGGKTIVVSGKLSEKSFSRWLCFRSLAKRFFGSIDLFCVQNEEHAFRFSKLVPDPSKIKVTGNLKFDMEKVWVPVSPIRPFLTISCTHPSEEEALLDQLKNHSYPIFLAPRHPERFESVADLLKKKQIPFDRWNEELRFDQSLILVDRMGVLPRCYAQSFLAIVGGSFVPLVGGHNVVEPCLYGCPSLFGPYTFGQKELVDKVLKAGAGVQVCLSKVRETVQKMEETSSVFSEKSLQMVSEMRGVSERTLQEVLTILEKN
jgi:3-deoxy-D-manno-octulosonic-acid transferase